MFIIILQLGPHNHPGPQGEYIMLAVYWFCSRPLLSETGEAQALHLIVLARLELVCLTELSAPGY